MFSFALLENQLSPFPFEQRFLSRGCRVVLSSAQYPPHRCFSVDLSQYEERYDLVEAKGVPTTNARS